METTAKDFKNSMHPPKDVRANAKSNNVVDAVVDKIEDMDLKEKYNDLQKKTIETFASARTYWKDHMAYSLAGAAAVGFLAGVLLRRKKSNH